MRKLIVISMITLDGVMQAPGGTKEDTADGFKFGGWSEPYLEDVGGAEMQKIMQPTDYLLGRTTFEIWERYWPIHADFWAGINDGTKYVMSTTRKKSDWQNTVFINSLQAIKKLKASQGPDLQVWGSSKLIQLLLKNDLVDELQINTHPIIIGSGKKLFGDGTITAAYTLTDTLVTPSGVIMARYKRAGKVTTGTIVV
jgi:dihydrofolate reductase